MKIRKYNQGLFPFFLFAIISSSLFLQSFQFIFLQENHVEGAIFFLRKESDQSLGQIFVIDPLSGNLSQITNIKSGVNEFIASPNGESLIVYSEDARIHLFDISTGNNYELNHPDLPERQAAWSPDSSKIAFLSPGISDPFYPPKGVILFDIATKSFSTLDEDRQHWGYNFAWSSDGNFLIWEQYSYDPPVDGGPKYWPINLIIIFSIDDEILFGVEVSDESEECSHPRILTKQSGFSCINLYGENDYDIFLHDFSANTLTTFVDAIPQNWLKPDLINNWHSQWTTDTSLLAFETLSGFSIFDISLGSSIPINTDGGRKPYWNPNANQLVFEMPGNNFQNLYIVDYPTNEITQLTSENVIDSNPVWVSSFTSDRAQQSMSNDTWIAYRGPEKNIWLISLDNSEKFQVTNDASEDVSYGGISWSPNGNLLAFTKWTKKELFGHDISFQIYDFESIREIFPNDQNFGGGYDWVDDETIIFDTEIEDRWSNSGVFKLDIISGEIEALLSPSGEYFKALTNPVLSPDRKSVMVTQPGFEPCATLVGVVDLSNQSISPMGSCLISCIWSPDSSSIYCSKHLYDQQPLLKIPVFDSSSSENILKTDEHFYFEGIPSPDGSMLAVNHGDLLFSDTLVLSAEGSPIFSIDDFFTSGWSPDGNLLLLENSGQIFVYDIETESISFLAEGSYPTWQVKGISNVDASIDSFHTGNQFENLLEEKIKLIDQLATAEFDSIYGINAEVNTQLDESKVIDLIHSYENSNIIPELEQEKFSRLVLQERAINSTLRDFEIIASDIADAWSDFVFIYFVAMETLIKSGTPSGLVDQNLKLMEDSLMLFSGFSSDEKSREIAKGTIDIVFDSISLKMSPNLGGVTETVAKKYLDVEIRKLAFESLLLNYSSNVQPTIDLGASSISGTEGEGYFYSGTFERANLQIQNIQNQSQQASELGHNQYKQFANGQDAARVITDLIDLTSRRHPNPLTIMISLYSRVIHSYVDFFAISNLQDAIECSTRMAVVAGDMSFNPDQIVATCVSSISSTDKLRHAEYVQIADNPITSLVTDASENYYSFKYNMSREYVLNWIGRENGESVISSVQDELRKYTYALDELSNAVEVGNPELIQVKFDEFLEIQYQLNNASNQLMSILYPPYSQVWGASELELAKLVTQLDYESFILQAQVVNYLDSPDDILYNDAIAQAFSQIKNDTTVLVASLDSVVFSEDAFPSAIPSIQVLESSISIDVGEPKTINVEVSNIGNEPFENATYRVLVGDDVIKMMYLPSIQMGETFADTIVFTPNIEGIKNLSIYVSDGDRSDFKNILVKVSDTRLTNNIVFAELLMALGLLIVLVSLVMIIFVLIKREA